MQQGTHTHTHARHRYVLPEHQRIKPLDIARVLGLPALIYERQACPGSATDSAISVIHAKQCGALASPSTSCSAAAVRRHAAIGGVSPRRASIRKVVLEERLQVALHRAIGIRHIGRVGVPDLHVVEGDATAGHGLRAAEEDALLGAVTAGRAPDVLVLNVADGNVAGAGAAGATASAVAVELRWRGEEGRK